MKRKRKKAAPCCRRCRKPIDDDNPGKPEERVCYDCEERTQSEEKDAWDEDRYIQRSHTTFWLNRVRSP